MNRISQYLVYPIVWFFSKLFLTVEFNNPEGLSAITGKPAIIVANHISFYDSFLLRLNPRSVDLSLYFMGLKSFDSFNMRFLWMTGLVPLVYKLFGVFLVYPGQGIEKNLEMPRKILSSNNQIFIFPEGSVNPNDELMPFKKGAATLATTLDVIVLPIAYKKVLEEGKKKKVIITIGETMRFAPGTSIEAANIEMQETIRTMLATK
ncbi:MAG TPA: lysophospholipid acyltransferase family protein [Candidatus Paceibacterota bacterium]|nr:lysophospholipid acyltransferase family protein [Candidatus Paceibacterota bacterium]